MKTVQLYMYNTDIYSCHLAIDLNVNNESVERSAYCREKL